MESATCQGPSTSVTSKGIQGIIGTQVWSKGTGGVQRCEVTARATLQSPVLHEAPGPLVPSGGQANTCYGFYYHTP